MISDCHTHLNMTGGVADIAGYLDSCSKVDSCIVLAEPGENSEAANKELAEAIKDQPKLTGFGVFDPLKDSPLPKKIKAMTVGLGLKGVVLYCSEGGFHPAHSRAMRLYEAAENLSMPIFFHNGGPLSSGAVLDFSQPYQIDEIARRFKKLKIVVGQMGIPFASQMISLIEKHENVYADLTINTKKPWEVYNLVLACHEAGVLDKLLFGSGYPAGDSGECIEMLLGFNKLMANSALPHVPREEIRAVIERDILGTLGISN